MNDELNNRFLLLKEYMEYYINFLAGYKYNPYYIVLFDKQVTNILKNKLEQDSMVQVGYINYPYSYMGEPDIKINGIEIRYLFKNKKPVTFDEWLLT